MTTELTLPQRAAVALGAAEHETQLALLAQEAQSITEIKNKDAREQCHAMMMTLKNARIAIEKTGKAAREDAQAFSKAVIADEKRLITITEAEENRLQALRDKWDAAIEAERQAKIEAERQRVAKIRSDIEVIKNMALTAVGKPVEIISASLELVQEIDVTPERFAEFIDEALIACEQTEARLIELKTAAVAAVAEAARMKAEREELARLRAEAEARRIDDERKAAQAKAVQEAVFEAERQRLANEQAEAEAELRRQRASQEAELRAEREAHQRELEAEQARIAAERAEIERQQAEIAEAKRRQEAEETAKREADEAEAERVRLQSAHDQALADARELSPSEQVALEAEGEKRFATAHPSLAKRLLDPAAAWPFPTKDSVPTRPTDEEIIEVLSTHFHVEQTTVVEWLKDMDLEVTGKEQAAA